MNVVKIFIGGVWKFVSGISILLGNSFLIMFVFGVLYYVLICEVGKCYLVKVRKCSNLCFCIVVL